MRKVALASLAFILLAATLILATVVPTNALPPPKFSTTAESMVLIDASNNEVLAEHNSSKRLPMASTTKIVTAITVIEKEKDLNRLVVVPKEAAGVEGSSIYLKAGDKLRIIDLLHGLMLRSGNDCAVTLAIAVSNSVEQFCLDMNNLAKKAGALNSNFTNPHGLHNDNHYTTASDLAKISVYAMKNEKFKTIAATKKYVFKMDGAEQNQVLLNKNKILSMLDGGDGIKTGFTKKAGRCLVSSATRNGVQLICVVFNCGPMFEDCSRLINEGFSLYKTQKIIDEKNYVAEFKAVNCDKEKFKGTVKKGFSITSRNPETQNFEVVATLDKNLRFPIKKGDKIGNVKIFASKQLLFEEKLYSIEDVTQFSPDQALDELLENQ